MMRITQATDGRSATRLRVEGRITDRDGDALRAACAPHLGTANALMVDLAGVSFVDAPGASALRDVERRGALLVGRSGFVAQVLRGAPGRPPRAPAAPRLAAPPASIIRVPRPPRARPRDPAEEEPLLARLRAGDELAF